MKALITWFQKLWRKPSNAGPAPTSVNSSASLPKNSTAAQSANEKPCIALLAKIAEKEIGRKETKGRNQGPDVRKYQAATNLEHGAWPWCAAFVCWCIQQWLADPDVRAWLDLKKSTPAAWRPKTALAFGFLKWAQARPATTTILPDTAEPQAGDIVVFDFSHIGIVIAAAPNGKMLTIEGNTNGAGSREGDSVEGKIRSRSLARCFIRIRPSGS